MEQYGNQGDEGLNAAIIKSNAVTTDTAISTDTTGTDCTITHCETGDNRTSTGTKRRLSNNNTNNNNNKFILSSSGKSEASSISTEPGGQCSSFSPSFLSGSTDDPSTGYKWTEEDTAELIAWRIENGALFTGRRNAALRGYEEFIKQRGLLGKIDPVKVKRKWENLKQKYKELKAPAAGVSTDGAETPAATWKWFRAMDEAFNLLTPCKTLPVLITSSGHTVVLKTSPSNCPRRSQDSEIPEKRKKESFWPSIFKTMLEKEDEKEKVCLEREDRMERERQEREEVRELERLEREEKREKERSEREERWERERREWEEKREKLYREREERREREWVERNERWERERRDWEEKRERESREREERRDREIREREERWERESQAREDKLFEVLKILMEKNR